MTKEDYIAIAACIKAEKDATCRSLWDDQAQAIYSLHVKIAIMLQTDNPCFDYAKFTKACGF